MSLGAQLRSIAAPALWPALKPVFASILRPIVDYALPPRCPACGEIVSDAGSFCAPCWQSIEFLGDPQCAVCGVPLPGRDATATGADEGVQCGACLADPPPYDRARAAMAYGAVGRTLAHKLKYGRRTSLARVMAGQMKRLMPDFSPSPLDQCGDDDQTNDLGKGVKPAATPANGNTDCPIIVPVPLHRWRIWSRGFNQAALIARALGRETGLPVETGLLVRTRNTPPLHSLGPRQRRQAVRSAFAIAPNAAERVRGRTILLVDDIWTTGSTAMACARVLRTSGAARIEILCWTRAGFSDD